MTSLLRSFLRPHFSTHQGYVSAGMESDKSADMVFLNANENPYALPGLEGLNRYPEPQPQALLKAYSDLYGVHPDWIAATRGADEAIAVLIRLFCEPHKDSIITCPPTFGIYKIDAATMPAENIEVPLIKNNGAFHLDVEGIIERAKDAKLIFLCSPNNPTGNAFPLADMRRICSAVEEEAVVVVDETYAEFAGQQPMTDFLAEHPNLITLRTLSKSYGLAGERMGCLLTADPDFIMDVRSKGLETYPLPRSSIESAMTVIKHQDHALRNIQTLLRARDDLRAELAKRDLIRTIYPSDANFLLIEMNSAAEFCAFCRSKNIYIRDFSDKPWTQDCIRLSIGTDEENALILDLLDEFAQTQCG